MLTKHALPLRFWVGASLFLLTATPTHAQISVQAIEQIAQRAQQGRAPSRLPDPPEHEAARTGAQETGSDRIPSLAPGAFQRHIYETTGFRLKLYGQHFFEGDLLWDPKEHTPVYTINDAQTDPERTGPPKKLEPEPEKAIPAWRPPFSSRALGAVSPDYVIGPGDEVEVKVFSPSVDLNESLIVGRDGVLVLPKIGPISVAGVRVADLNNRIRQALSRSLSDFNVYTALGRLKGIEVYVTGLARAPGKYSLTSTSTAISALFATGGPSAQGSFRKIQILRGGKVVSTIDLYDFISRGDVSRDVALRNGDVINIPRSGAQVALVGVAELPAVYELSQNEASLASVLELSGGLPANANPRRLLIERTDPHRRTPLSTIAVDLQAGGHTTPLEDGDIIRIQAGDLRWANSVSLVILDNPAIRLPIGAGQRVSDLIGSPEALRSRESTLSELIGLKARASKTLQSEGKKEDSNARLERAAMARDAQYLALRASIEAREVNWERALIERQAPGELQPKLIGFNLEAALIKRDPSENIELLPGDVVRVLGRSGVIGPSLNKTRLVRIQGEIMNPGLYQINPGETLSSLVSRAGGYTPQAYLFGTELKRKRVQVSQLANLEEAAKRLESKLSSDEGLTGLNTGTENALAVQQILLARNRQRLQEQIDRLRRAKPSGRVALELDPANPRPPDIPLEDEDEILIPTTPSSVFVAGAVINENALIYRPNQSARAVLQQSGLMPNADLAQAFILRADGSVVLPNVESNDSSFWGSDTLNEWFKPSKIQSIALMPGDTVIVPEKQTSETSYAFFMRGLKDWTQVLYQLGLGAAAVRTLN